MASLPDTIQTPRPKHSTPTHQPASVGVYEMGSPLQGYFIAMAPIGQGYAAFADRRAIACATGISPFMIMRHTGY
jgi:hypothetical protein